MQSDKATARKKTHAHALDFIVWALIIFSKRKLQLELEYRINHCVKLGRVLLKCKWEVITK